MRACLIDATNTVVNAILVGDGYEPPEGLTLIVGDGNIGDVWGGACFVPPPPPEIAIEDQIAAAIATVDAIYAAKFETIRTDLATATLTDGAGMDAAIATLRAKWADAWSAYGIAIDAAVAAILGE